MSTRELSERDREIRLMQERWVAAMDDGQRDQIIDSMQENWNAASGPYVNRAQVLDLADKMKANFIRDLLELGLVRAIVIDIARARVVQWVLYEKDHGSLGRRVRDVLERIDRNQPAARDRIAAECN
jgi:hypothetical protein